MAIATARDREAADVVTEFRQAVRRVLGGPCVMWLALVRVTPPKSEYEYIFNTRCPARVLPPLLVPAWDFVHPAGDRSDERKQFHGATRVALPPARERRQGTMPGARQQSVGLFEVLA